MAEVTLAQISPVQADLGTIVALSAQRYGPKRPWSRAGEP